MTNYHLKTTVPQQPEQVQDDAFTREQRRRVEQRKTERKAVLTRVWQKRARAYYKQAKKLKARIAGDHRA